jgi:hypothetical protein
MVRDILIRSSVVFVLAACSSGSHAPVETCEEAGQRCRVDESVIGICNEPVDRSSCVEGSPCLVCTPQH